jgi:hypothetical protein
VRELNEPRRIALLGFLPWNDPGRNVAVRENPAAITAERCARALAQDGHSATFVPVPVSGDGIRRALEAARLLDAEIIVALGQTPTEPRVERVGRVAGSWSPAVVGETTPWTLAPDADELVARLNSLADPAAQLQPFRASDDAGAYFCDHLCVELARDARVRPVSSRFLHLTAIDDCAAEVKAARLGQYARQARAVVEWLMLLPVGGAV